MLCYIAHANGIRQARHTIISLSRGIYRIYIQANLEAFKKFSAGSLAAATRIVRPAILHRTKAANFIWSALKIISS
jgi:hypothetical protein